MVALMVHTLRQSEAGLALCPNEICCVMLVAAAAHDLS
eukprot:g14963.t1